MRLKKLQLVGFKTFADKTEIEFGEGMTAVVGPNGCGKSNISDALLWVMGEQNPRLLRGSESRDVIFNGTDKRKPLGMAEVKLTLDNSDNGLAIDFGEITVTRRIYRSGESQYLLNNAPCRMKDIVELFLDTGIGKGAYSFVSQSEIDAVLSARAEDRRELFEEAAGIKKYRVRKREAVRKLDQAESNLNRIRDIVHELEQQRAPLEAQAELARRYLKLTERLQEIEVGLLIAEIKKADYELYAARQERELDQEGIQKYDAELAVLERESEAVGERLAEAERELDSARMSRQGALSSLERTESQLQLAKERGKGAEKSSETLDAELKELSERTTALNKEIGQQMAEIEQDESQQAAKRDAFAAATARLRELDGALAEVVRQSEDRQGVLRRLAEQRAQREAALAACRSRITDTEARLTRLDEEAKGLAAQLSEAEARVAEMKATLEKLKTERDTCQRHRAELEAERKTWLDKQGAAAIALDAARRLLAERSSRLSTLTELQESGDGFFQGVRAILKATRDGEVKGRFAAIVDLLTVPEELRVAIEIALGASIQDIVCDTEAEAKAAIDWLKRNRAGRATFLALPMLRPGRSLTRNDLRGVSGLLGIASDKVGIDPHYDLVREMLLGRVILAEEMDSAIHASKRLDGWHRIVTIDGELVTPTGALTGGSLQGRGAHLVGRKGEIDDLKRAMPGLRKEVDKQNAAMETARARVAEIDAELAALGKEIGDLQARAAASESALKGLEREESRLAGARRESDAETARLCDAHDKLTAEAARWQEAVEAGKAEDTSADDAIAAAQERAKELAAQRDEARSVAVAMEVEASRLKERLNGLRHALAANQESLRRTESSRRGKQAQRELAGTQFRDADDMQHTLELKLAELKESLTVCEEQVKVWTEKRQELLQENFAKSNAIKETSRQRSDTMQALHDAELQIARMEVKLAQTSQRLLDEYGLTQEDALAREEVEEIGRETVNEVARLRREVRQMGQVNTGAVEEYERLTERHAFLTNQREDLEKARESLLTTIAEIDDSTRGAFMDTFGAVQAEFARLFNRLFGGGTTKLVLTNPEDLLETGIEVIAQPPGKKPQHLSLLSGGERALTAAALLFSFLTVRPSPFVLLDEVDAPLDGANVEKFVSLISEFSQTTQFLVITHNPTTMEAAPRWYGVTMKEPGVSSILSYRVPKEALPSEGEEVLVLQEDLPL